MKAQTIDELEDLMARYSAALLRLDDKWVDTSEQWVQWKEMYRRWNEMKDEEAKHK